MKRKNQISVPFTCSGSRIVLKIAISLCNYWTSVSFSFCPLLLL